MKNFKQIQKIGACAASVLIVSILGAGSAMACDPDRAFYCGEDPKIWGTATAYAFNTNTNYEGGSFYANKAYLGYDLTKATDGIGVTNKSSESSGIDNTYDTDFVLLNFNPKVLLSSITLGLGSNATADNTDFSVYAWQGGGDPSVPGTLTPSILNSSWKWLGNYDKSDGTNVDNYDYKVSLDADKLTGTSTSSWWIISAYNSTFSNSQTVDGVADSFRILSVACNTGSNGNVSEPASMLMLGAGLIGMLAMRRRRQAIF